jgi:predicted Zn finger-like uncharacterized protein
MAKFQVSCPGCQTPYQVDDALLGRKARCNHCQTGFVLTRPAEAAGSGSFSWPWLTGGRSGGASAAKTIPGSGERSVAPDGVPEFWRVGDVILGLYEVREVFTSGGMGLVYRVRHHGWNVDLAVKCPRPQFFLNEQDKENFEREAETWVKLGLHPHTVTCHYVRRLGGIPRVFAEFVAGGSLAEWIRTRKLYAGGPRPTLARVLDVAIQFAWGLHHAHEQGLVHRDVKPGNVLLTAEGVAKVTDFGMARARGTAAPPAAGAEGRSILVSAGGLTPAYCSPEQVLGQPVSRKTDLWSWGVAVLEMFTGAVTWSAGHLAADALADYRRRGRPDERLPVLPPALADLLGRCFQRDPEARPRDLPEVVAELLDIYRQAIGRAYHREVPAPAEALADSLNNRAVSLLDLNKQPEAEQLWQEALTAGPNHPESTYNLGLSRWRCGRMTGEALLQKLQEVCATHPGDWLPQYLLALAHLEQGGWPTAVEILETLVKTGHNTDEVQAALTVAREYLASADRCLRTFQGHSDWVSSVCFSDDGRLALSGGADRAVKLWDVATGRLLHTFEGHTEWVTSVGLSTDGSRALSGSADRTLRLWDVTTGTCLRTIAAHTKWVLAAALSGDGRLALSGGGDGLLRLWDLDASDCLRNFDGHREPVLAVCLSADGRRALTGSRDTTLKLWDVASGECLRTFEGHADRVLAVGLSGDGRLALSGSGDRTLKLWEAETGRCLRTWAGHEAAVLAVSLSLDGRHALSGGGDRTVRLWRLTLDRCLFTLEGHTGTVNSVAFAAGGRYALSGSGDRTLRLWGLPRDLPAPYLVSRVQDSTAVLAARTEYHTALEQAWLALSAGDAPTAARRLREARSQPGYARRPEAMKQWAGLYVRLARKGLNGGWEGNTLEGHLGAVTAVAVSRDGRHVLSGSADWTLKLWEVESGQCLRTLEGHTGVVTAVCLSRDSRHALSGGVDRTVRWWELTTGRCLIVLEGHFDSVTSVACSGDGRLALSGSADRTVRVWELAGGRCLRLLEGHTDPVHSVALAGDGRLALSGSAQFLVRNDSERLFTSGQLKLWDVVTGRCLPTFEGHSQAVTVVHLAADGRLALSGGGQANIDPTTGKSSPSGSLHLWELATGHGFVTFAGHADAITSADLSPDSRYVLSGSTDRTVRLWDAATGQCLRTFEGHTDAVTSTGLSADGRYAVSGSADGTLKLWVLDWELGENEPAFWDDGARPYLEAFLAEHTPYAAPVPSSRKRTVREIVSLPLNQLFSPTPTEREIQLALTRRGKPVWTEESFEELLYTLGCAGYGWLRPEGVRKKLEQMARKWKG